MRTSIYYKSLWLHHVGYQNLKKDDVFTLVWNPALEARPQHIIERHGDNRQETVSMVEFPPVRQDASRDAANSLPDGDSCVRLEDEPCGEDLGWRCECGRTMCSYSGCEVKGPHGCKQCDDLQAADQRGECRLCAFGAAASIEIPESKCTCIYIRHGTCPRTRRTGNSQRSQNSPRSST